MKSDSNLYDILGVSPSAERVVIEAAYRALMRDYQSKVGTSAEIERKVQRINVAYSTLSNPRKRALYDAGLKAAPSKASSDELTPPLSPSETPADEKVPSPSEPLSDNFSTVYIEQPNADRWNYFWPIALAIVILMVVLSSMSGQPTAPAENTMNLDENMAVDVINVVDAPLNDTAASAQDELGNQMASTSPPTSPVPDGASNEDGIPQDSDGSQEESLDFSASARASGNLLGLFSDEDYPASAQAAGAEGTVRAQLTIGPDGRVARCDIIQSSGNAALDAATCSILRRRAQFIPARDSNGNPTTDVVTTPPITWRLEG